MKHQSWKEKKFQLLLEHQQETMEAKKALAEKLLSSQNVTPWSHSFLSNLPQPSLSWQDLSNAFEKVSGASGVQMTVSVTTVPWASLPLKVTVTSPTADTPTDSDPAGPDEKAARELLIRAIPDDHPFLDEYKRFAPQKRIIAQYNDSLTQEEAEAWFERAFELTL